MTAPAEDLARKLDELLDRVVELGAELDRIGEAIRAYQGRPVRYELTEAGAQALDRLHCPGRVE